MDHRTKENHKAIVIGASMAGLLAARVCADHFNEVVLLEKDEIDPRTTFRKGVPQGHQLHLVLAKGLENIVRFFPGITDKLIEKGAVMGDMGEKLQWYAAGGMRPQCETGLNTIMMSRPLLENTVREALLELPNVKLLAGARIKNLTAAGNYVTGVCTDRGYHFADLTIDARGMASDLMSTLEEIQYELPRVEKVKVNVKYTSCVFPKPPEYSTLINVNTEPPRNTKHGTIQPIEGDQMLVMLQGRSNDEAPKEIAAFKEFAAELESPAIHRMIRDLDPVSGIKRYNIPYVRWIHFEAMRDFPEGILPLGDAICRLNPVYGQGMTSASIQANILNDLLRRKGSKGIWKSYFKRVATAIKSPWELTLSEDFKFPETEGTPPKMPGILVRYFNKLNLAMNKDPFIYKHFMRVLNMTAGPQVLLRPDIFWRVITARL